MATPNEYTRQKWKHRFDCYRDMVPSHYNDYINSCLKFIEMKLKK